MFGVDDFLIGAAISGLGAGVTSFFNKESTEDTNAMNAQLAAQNREFNALEAQKNRDFQERMSNSAYQRGMTDMRQAGLNPILAYQRGGASSPTGSTATGTAATMQAPKIDNVLGDALQGGMALASARQTLANQKATEDNIRTDTVLKDAQTAKTLSEDKTIGTRLPVHEKEALQANIDKTVYTNSAARATRAAGQVAEDASRVVDPVVNSASKLLRGYNDTRTRRSTVETSDTKGNSSFSERFHY